MVTLINAAPVIVDEKLPIRKALQQMLKARATCLLVSDAHQQIIGIVTRGDVNHAFAKALEKDHPLEFATQAIAEVMTTPVEYVHRESLSTDIHRLRESEEIEHFPLLRTHGPPNIDNLVGIITFSSIGKYLLPRLSEEFTR